MMNSLMKGIRCHRRFVIPPFDISNNPDIAQYNLKSFGLTEGFYKALIFLGEPVIAVAIGLLISIYTLTTHRSRKDVINELEDSMKSAGIIIFVTGGGGALGQVIKSAGVGDYIAKGMAATSLPIIILPFIIANSGPLLYRVPVR